VFNPPIALLGEEVRVDLVGNAELTTPTVEVGGR